MKLKWILRESKTDQAGQDANDRSGGKWCFLQIFFFLKTANLLRDYQALPHDASTTKSQSARGRGGNAADAPTNFIMCNFNTLKAAVVNSTARVQCSRCPNFKQELIGN